MAELRYIGQHGPNDIRRVPDKRVDEFLKTGLYEKVGDNLVVSKSSSKKEKKIGVKEEKDVYEYIPESEEE